MKKRIIVLVVLAIMATIVTAQNDPTKFFQKVQGGMIVGTSASTTFSGAKQPFVLGYYLLTNMTVVTPKTYHNFMYSFGNNSLKFLTGYYLSENKKWDAYFVYSKVLNTDQNYLFIGIEKMVKAEDIKCFIYSEVGTDFNKTKTLSIGVRISLQNVFWERKKK